MKDKILLTGGRPTGKLHLGHYLGAFKEFVNLQEKYKCFFVLSDIHMLTTAATKNAISQIWENSLNMVLDVISMGVNPDKTVFYLQSNVYEMPYYYTLIQNFIDYKRIHETTSLIQTIDEMKKNASLEEVSLGLLAYPVMEAADILSLNADVVTVGKDNIDHVEIAKLIVDKINKESDFKLKTPEWISTANNNVVGIDGNSKMSKSLNNCIYVSDSYETIKNKVSSIRWENDNINDNIVVQYLKAFAPCIYGEEFLEQDVYKGEKFCKNYLIDVLEDLLNDMRLRRAYYEKNQDYILDIILEGTGKVQAISKSSLRSLKEGLGYNKKYCIW